jgi:hypothetical protein
LFGAHGIATIANPLPGLPDHFIDSGIDCIHPVQLLSGA